MKYRRGWRSLIALHRAKERYGTTVWNWPNFCNCVYTESLVPLHSYEASVGILASSQCLWVIYFGFIYFIDCFAGQRQMCWSQQKQVKKENTCLKSVPLLLLPVYLWSSAPAPIVHHCLFQWNPVLCLPSHLGVRHGARRGVLPSSKQEGESTDRPGAVRPRHLLPGCEIPW